MELDKSGEFTRLTTKFLFLNCNDGKNEINKIELNAILNELNSIDFSGANVDQNAAIRLLESFIYIPSSEDTLIVKSCCLISAVINKQKIQVPAAQFKEIIDWQLKCLNFNFHNTVCDILTAMQSLFKHHKMHCKDYWDVLLSPDGLFIKLLTKCNNKNSPEQYDNNSSEEIVISTICCIESLLNLSEDDTIRSTDEISATLAVIGSKILDIFYNSQILINASNHHMNLITTSLNILLRIASINREWCNSNIGELLGIAKAYMLYGLPDVPLIKPQKVYISQQSIQEPVVLEQSNKGGKVAKTRKPRTNHKNKKVENKSKSSKDEDDSAAATSSSKLQVDVDSSFVLTFNKTSDSDFSESEANRSRNERHKQAKLRITAITLIGFIAKNTQKRVLYGYWHSLFPSETMTPTTSALFNSVLRDSNPRCRIAALQTAAVLIYGSRPFLVQAESRTAPTSYFPFSISLGHMIIKIYEALTIALSNENSLPVIIQILKCMSVTIQATPFHRLESGFVTEFIRYVKRLIYHRDPTIQVGALTVMEFLISSPDLTPEISQIVGIPKHNFVTKQLNQNRLNDSGVEEVIDGGEYNEETIDSDYEDDNQIDDRNDNSGDSVNFNMSWLLQKALENLGVIVKDRQPKTSPSTTPVRIESLQVLSAMTSHFLLLKDHLQFISATLKITLNDVHVDVKLYTAKCLDSLGHSINTFLLEKGSIKNEDMCACNQFWVSILPSVIEKIQDSTESAPIKSILCDFMSNIGVHIFERLPHSGQMQLISLLSGASCNEEHTVRAAASRALAVFVLFPSLREDLCFVENTAESILELIQDSHLFVRIKASWSMGNISDALITNCFQIDRISDDLLRRMFETAIVSAGDNDKVRSNAVRSLGNLLRLISKNHLQSEMWRSVIFRSIEKLGNCMSAGGNVKVKWNSCYAVGNFMKNEILFNSHNDFNWRALILPSLCNIIINSTNFKVRINGAAALTNIQSRENVGTFFALIWSSLLTAVEQADNLHDFTEYKHRDNLHEQLCMSISHMIKLSTKEDYCLMNIELIPKVDTISQTWTRVINRVLPENTAPLLSSALKLQELLKSNELTSEQKNAVKSLCNCFIQPILL